MRARTRRTLLASLILASPFLAGCGLANQADHAENTVPIQASPGERQGTVPISTIWETVPSHPAGTPQRAVERFAIAYINWTYRTLSAVQAGLAQSAVGEARTAELSAKARTQADRMLARAQVYNKGTIVAIAPVRDARPGEWVIDTREQTGGNSEYAVSTRPAFHVTLASVRRVSDGFVVSAWRPQV